MPGIPFLDSITDYRLVCLLSDFIQLGPNLFTVLTVSVFGFDFWSWKTRHKWSKRLMIVAHTAVITPLIFCILYSNDRRYSQTDIGNLDNPNATYFGKEKNGMPDTFGKLYNAKDEVIYVGEWSGGKRDGQGTEYKRDSTNATYVAYDGSFVHDLRDGTGSACDYAEDGSRTTYDGGYFEGERTGNGLLQMFDSEGNLTYSYDGCWSHDKHYGHGTEIYYESGEPTFAYRSLYWNDTRVGEGICEYYTEAGHELVVWRGKQDSDGHFTEDGMYYHGNGKAWPAEANRTQVTDESGNLVDDQERIDELRQAWPFPHYLIAGN